MPVNKNAYLRYLHIHSQIKRNKYIPGFPTKQNLLDYLADQGIKSSESGLEKDIWFLKYERDAPIVYDRYQRCYKYTRDWDFDIPITPDAVGMMKMLLHKLQIFADSREFKSFSDSIEKVSRHLSLSWQHPGEPIEKYILFEYSKGFAGRIHLPQIYDAIFTSREICFTHIKFDQPEKTCRTIQPYILKEHRNRWYVIGKEDGNPKIFGLDRIHELTITDKVFHKDKEFYDEMFRVLYDSVGVMAFDFPTEEVILRFDKAQAHYVDTLMLHRSQKEIASDEQGKTYSFHVKVTPEFIMDCILRFGSEVKVLKPESLAKKVKSIYSSAFGKYQPES